MNPSKGDKKSHLFRHLHASFKMSMKEEARTWCGPQYFVRGTKSATEDAARQVSSTNPHWQTGEGEWKAKEFLSAAKVGFDRWMERFIKWAWLPIATSSKLWSPLNLSFWVIPLRFFSEQMQNKLYHLFLLAPLEALYETMLSRSVQVFLSSHATLHCYSSSSEIWSI